MNIPVYLIFEILSFIISLTLYFQKNTSPYLKLFPPFLFLTIIVEILAIEFGKRGGGNILLYKVFITVEFEFYLFSIRSFIQGTKAKKVLLYTLYLYPVMALFNIYFAEVNSFHSITYSIGCLLVISACIYYIFELFRLPKFVNLSREPAFWICSGLLFFYSCSFPLFGLINYLFNVSGALRSNLSFILALMNVLLYSLFSVGFLCRIKFRKSKK